MRRHRLPALYLLALALLLAALQWAGWERTWRALSIPPMTPVFADMRTVQGALASRAAGLDPQRDNVGDPWRRRMNYPRVWIRIADALGLEREARYRVAVAAGVALFVAAAALLLHLFPSAWLLAALLSGAALLAMERGNNDLLVFVLVVAAALLPLRLLSAVLILLATVLKLYPFAAALMLLQARRLAWFALTAAAGLLYLHGASAEIAVIREGTPVSTALSYGVPSLARWLGQRLGTDIPALALVLPLALLGLGVAWAMRAMPLEAADATPGAPPVRGAGERARALFLAGAAIYLGTFVLAANFDYRLIFLALCIPLLATLPQPRLRRVALAALLLAMNESLLRAAFGPFGFLLNLAAELLVFVLLCGVLGRLLRERLGALPLAAVRARPAR